MGRLTKIKQTLIIEGELLDHNNYIGANRANKFMGSKKKREQTDLIAWNCISQNLKPMNKKINLKVAYYCKNKRKDKDNIAFSIKFILDGLQQAKIIKNDGWKEVGNFEFEFYVDKERPRVEIELEEAK